MCGKEDAPKQPWDVQFWVLIGVASALSITASIAAHFSGPFNEWSKVVLPPVYWPVLVGLASFLFRRPLAYILDEVGEKVRQLVKGPQGTEFDANLSAVNVPPPAGVVPASPPAEASEATVQPQAPAPQEVENEVEEEEATDMEQP